MLIMLNSIANVTCNVKKWHFYLHGQQDSPLFIIESGKIFCLGLISKLDKVFFEKLMPKMSGDKS